MALGEQLPSDRHSPLLNAMRLAKGFLVDAGLPFEERYRVVRAGVLRTDAAAQLLRERRPAARDPLLAAFLAASGSDDELNRMLGVDAETQLPDDLLLLTDKMTMAVSLECRVPLLDHELVELAARIPAGVKVRGGRLKHVHEGGARGRAAARRSSTRKKRGFGTPMGAWLKGDLAPLLRALLSRGVGQGARTLPHPAVAALIAAHDANRVDGTDRLLALLNLEIWARIYLDRRAAGRRGGRAARRLAS